MKIFGKLMTLVGSTIVCLVVAFCLVGYFILTDFGDSSAQKQLRIASKTMQKTIEEQKVLQATLGSMIPHDEEFSRLVAEKEIDGIRTVAKRLQAQPGVDFVTVCDAEGKVLVRAHSDKAGDVLGLGRQSAAIPLQQGKSVVGLEPGNEVKLTLASGTPLNYKGQRVGAVILGTDLSSGVFVNALKAALDVECTIFIDDTRVSTTVMRDGKPAVGTPLNNDDIYKNVIRDGQVSVSRNIIVGKEYDTIYWPWKDISGKNAGIFFVGLSREDIKATQDKVLFSFILAGTVLAALLLGAAALVSRAIVRPLRAATTYAQSVAEGNFDSVITATSSDEVGSLVNALKSMVAQLKERLGFAQGIMRGIAAPFAVVDAGGKLTYLNDQLVTYWGKSGKPEDFFGQISGEFFYDDANEKTQLDKVLADRQLMLGVPLALITANGEKKYMRITASPLWDLDGNLLGACVLYMDETEIRQQQNRILALNERITLSVKEANNISQRQGDAFKRLTDQLNKTSDAAIAQTEASEQTMQSIAQMSSTLEGLAEKAKQTTEDTRATRTEAEDGNTIVSETVECITKVSDYAARTENGMQSLGKQAESITHIVELIKDIADQTNLLALNAAIEAARAGETGRGFAVVADEVRKLAEKTMEATEDVNKSVSALQTEVAQNVELTKETVQLTQVSTELAEKSGESLNRIVTIAEHAVGEVLSISEATAEQARSGVTLAGAMENMNAMARQSAQNMNESTGFVAELASLAEELKDLVESMGKDRRRMDRCSLDSPYLLAVTIDGGATYSCRLLDLNSGGMRVEIQNGGQVRIAQNTPVRINAGDPPLGSVLHGMTALVVWQDGILCGIEFARELPMSLEDLRIQVAQFQAQNRALV